MRIGSRVDGIASRLAMLHAERVRERVVAEALAELAERARRRGTNPVEPSNVGEVAPPQQPRPGS